MTNAATGAVRSGGAKPRTALLTGAAGCCGRALARALAGDGGYDVVAVTARATAGPWTRNEVVDLRDGELVRSMLERVRPDVVFHLAGRIDGGAAELLAHNTLATAHLGEALVAVRPDARLVAAGSSAEYGGGQTAEVITESAPCAPRRPYGIAKLAATQLLLGLAERHGLSVAVARLSNLLGPGLSPRLLAGSLVQQLAACRRQGRALAVTVGDLDAERDFLDVEDACRAFLVLGQPGAACGVFHVAAGTCHPVRELVTILQDVAGAPIEVRHDPALVRAGEPKVVRLRVAAAAASGFTASVPLRASLARMWAAALAAPAEVAR